jgi:Mg-chelatase subunit ChlD
MSDSNIDKYLKQKGDNSNSGSGSGSTGISKAGGGAISQGPDGKLRIGLPSLHTKVAQAQQQAAQEVDTTQQMPQRIALMLDCSSSMGEQVGAITKMQALKNACEGFVEAIDFDKTSVAIATFPTANGDYNDEGNLRGSLKLTRSPDALKVAIASLNASGGTPLNACMSNVIESLSITRGVVVSDGEAGDMTVGYTSPRKENSDEPTDYREQGNAVDGYVSMGIPMDCVHIGTDTGGEALLEWIAHSTGGVFIKFKDIASFGKALKYLSPRYRALLNAPGAAALIGADKVK